MKNIYTEFHSYDFKNIKVSYELTIPFTPEVVIFKKPFLVLLYTLKGTTKLQDSTHCFVFVDR